MRTALSAVLDFNHLLISIILDFSHLFDRNLKESAAGPAR